MPERVYQKSSVQSRLAARLLPGQTDLNCLPERACRRFVIAVLGGFGYCNCAGTEDSDAIRLRQQLMKLLADRVGTLAFRAGKGAHEKNDSNARGVRFRRQPGIYFCGREMPCIDSLAAQQPHEQLGRKFIG